MISGWKADRLAFMLAAMVLAVLTLGAGMTRTRYGSLVIGDSNLATWMPINNSFSVNHETSLWEGVLIQLGDYVDEQGDPLGVRGTVILRDRRGRTRQLKNTEFRWINIVAVDSFRGEPMGSGDVAALFPDPANPGACNAVEQCVESSCGGAGSSALLDRCQRKRSLHGRFVPVSIITYWHGQNGYEVSVNQLTATRHNQYAFTFKDEVAVFVDGQAAEFGRLERIDVVIEDGFNHGLHEEPPW